MTTEGKQVVFRVSKGDAAKCPVSQSYAVDLTVKVTLPADHVICTSKRAPWMGSLVVQALERSRPDLLSFPYYVCSEWRFDKEHPDTAFHAVLVAKPAKPNSDGVSPTTAVLHVADGLRAVLNEPEFLTAATIAADR